MSPLTLTHWLSSWSRLFQFMSLKVLKGIHYESLQVIKYVYRAWKQDQTSEALPSFLPDIFAFLSLYPSHVTSPLQMSTFTGYYIHILQFWMWWSLRSNISAYNWSFLGPIIGRCQVCFLKYFRIFESASQVRPLILILLASPLDTPFCLCLSKKVITPNRDII